MKIPWSKKQTILIGALLGVLLCIGVVLIAVFSGDPGTAVPADADMPEYSVAAPADENEELVVYDDSVVPLKRVTTPPPDLALDFRTDDAYPMPENGAVLPLGQAYSIGGKVLSNYPLDSVTVSISCAHNLSLIHI